MGDTEPPPREKSRSRSRSPPRENGDRPKEGGVAEFGGQGGERDRDRDFSRGGSVSPILMLVVERERETAANRSR